MRQNLNDPTDGIGEGRHTSVLSMHMYVHLNEHIIQANDRNSKRTYKNTYTNKLCKQQHVFTEQNT